MTHLKMPRYEHYLQLYKHPSGIPFQFKYTKAYSVCTLLLL